MVAIAPSKKAMSRKPSFILATMMPRLKTILQSLNLKLVSSSTNTCNQPAWPNLSHTRCNSNCTLIVFFLIRLLSDHIKLQDGVYVVRREEGMSVTRNFRWREIWALRPLPSHLTSPPPPTYKQPLPTCITAPAYPQATTHWPCIWPCF